MASPRLVVLFRFGRVLGPHDNQQKQMGLFETMDIRFLLQINSKKLQILPCFTLRGIMKCILTNQEMWEVIKQHFQIDPFTTYTSLYIQTLDFRRPETSGRNLRSAEVSGRLMDSIPGFCWCQPRAARDRDKSEKICRARHTYGPHDFLKEIHRTS